MSRFWRLCWLFALASMAGFLMESAESLLTLGYVQNRQGLLYGPFAPVYGAGAVTLALLWPLVKPLNPAGRFCAAALAGTAVEFLWSWGQEMLFGAVFWDYHHFRFHLDGRVNLPFSLIWGALGLAFWAWVWPAFRARWAGLPSQGAALVGLALAMLLTLDGMWSAAVLVRQDQRRSGVAAFSPLTAYLDTAWPDAALKAQFPTMKFI